MPVRDLTVLVNNREADAFAWWTILTIWFGEGDSRTEYVVKVLDQTPRTVAERACRTRREADHVRERFVQEVAMLAEDDYPKVDLGILLHAVA